MGWGGECGREGVFQSLLCFPNLICPGAIVCSITVMANASLLMCLNRDVFKGQANNLGWEMGGL